MFWWKLLPPSSSPKVNPSRKRYCEQAASFLPASYILLQNIELFIITALRTSNPIQILEFFVVYEYKIESLTAREKQRLNELKKEKTAVQNI
jgi:hypothetical protein